MESKRGQVGLILAALVTAAAAGGGCKMLRRSPGQSASIPAAPPPEADPGAQMPAAPPLATASDPIAVKTYRDQVAASGTYRLRKALSVFAEPDRASSKLGGANEGALIDIKAVRGSWVLIDWPSGPGAMSPGWAEVPLRAGRIDPSMASEVRNKEARRAP